MGWHYTDDGESFNIKVSIACLELPADDLLSTPKATLPQRVTYDHHIIVPRITFLFLENTP